MKLQIRNKLTDTTIGDPIKRERERINQANKYDRNTEQEVDLHNILNSKDKYNMDQHLSKEERQQERKEKFKYHYKASNSTDKSREKARIQLEVKKNHSVGHGHKENFSRTDNQEKRFNHTSEGSFRKLVANKCQTRESNSGECSS